jgi:hypothetical protein
LGSERASSALNAGQAVILAIGMTGVLTCAALGVGRGGLEYVGPISGRVGDLGAFYLTPVSRTTASAR